jgi:hypothetical protein
MAVAWPTVRARLAAALPAVVGSGVTVYDGPVVSGATPTAYLTIAHSPSSETPSVGDFRQDVAPDGFSAAEDGTVLCELGAITGGTDMPTIFGTFDAIASWVQSDMTLGGVLSQGSTCTVAAQVVQAQTTSGAVQRLVLTFTYFTRIA